MIDKHYKKKSRTYEELLDLFQPVPISSKTELSLAQEVIYELLGKGRLNQDEKKYLELLGILVEYYEKRNLCIPDLHGIDLLKALITEHDLRQKDLVDVFKATSIVSDVLNGKRNMTINHIKKLSEKFHISPSAFFPKKIDY